MAVYGRHRKFAPRSSRERLETTSTIQKGVITHEGLYSDGESDSRDEDFDDEW